MKHHLIYDCEKGKVIGATPYEANDPNHGLPSWFFDGNYTNFVIDFDKDEVEWVPPMGPAPCWEVKYSDVKDDLWGKFTEWCEETY